MIIGITTTYEEDHGYERANVEYLERIAQAGGTPVLLPPAPGGDEAAIAAAREVATRIDGLVLSGGGDIDPALYEEARLPETVNVAHTRDIYEMALARYAHELDLPVLGICRGMQVMNVALGGTLYQDMNACGLTAVDHQQQPPYDATEQRADAPPAAFWRGFYADVPKRAWLPAARLAGLRISKREERAQAPARFGSTRCTTRPSPPSHPCCACPPSATTASWKPWRIRRGAFSWACSGIPSTFEGTRLCSKRSWPPRAPESETARGAFA